MENGRWIEKSLCMKKVTNVIDVLDKERFGMYWLQNEFEHATKIKRPVIVVENEKTSTPWFGGGGTTVSG